MKPEYEPENAYELLELLLDHCNRELARFSSTTKDELIDYLQDLDIEHAYLIDMVTEMIVSHVDVMPVHEMLKSLMDSYAASHCDER